MKIMNNNSNRGKSIFKAVAVCMAVLAAGLFASCDDDMDIQQSYPFTVETMPVPHDVAKGQTVEIRCEMKKEGNFANTLYTIRYFQYEGKGTLKMDNGTVFLPNDRYLLENEKFRLYYTSQCDETQNFIVVVEDNFGNSHEMEFDFNNSNTSETESDSVPAVSPSTSKQICYCSVSFRWAALCRHRSLKGKQPREQGFSGCRNLRGHFCVCAILRAGTRKRTILMSAGGIASSRARNTRHAP